MKVLRKKVNWTLINDANPFLKKVSRYRQFGACLQIVPSIQELKKYCGTLVLDTAHLKFKLYCPL